MDQLQIIASALGLSALAGIRLYATVLAVGLIIRNQWFSLPQALNGLSILADTRILIAAGVFMVIEFAADKVPWIDSAWDSFHTFVRPIGAVLLTGALGAELDPVWKMLLMILGGTVALTSHGAKSATRVAVNHSPEPASNILLSAAEDLAVPAGIWLTMNHPLIMGGIVLVCLAFAAWLGPKIYRLLKIEFAAVGAWIRSWGSGDQVDRTAAATEPTEKFYLRHRYLWEEMPQNYRDALRKDKIADDGPAVRAVGSKTMGTGSQIGYLTLTPGELVFVCKKLIGFKTVRIPLSAIQEIREDRRFIVDSIEIDLGREVHSLDIFKSPSQPAQSSVNIASPTTA
jgi:hypothetical protein